MIIDIGSYTIFIKKSEERKGFYLVCYNIDNHIFNGFSNNFRTIENAEKAALKIIKKQHKINCKEFNNYFKKN